jgi:hypothetical protein
MQRELWIIVGGLSSIAVIASICTAALPKVSVDHGAVSNSDRSMLLVSENSPYMRNER